MSSERGAAGRVDWLLGCLDFVPDLGEYERTRFFLYLEQAALRIGLDGLEEAAADKSVARSKRDAFVTTHDLDDVLNGRAVFGRAQHRLFLGTQLVDIQGKGRLVDDFHFGVERRQTGEDE